MSGLYADLDTASLIGEHEAYLDYRQEFARCNCGDKSPHRAHLAAILDAHYADRVRAAQEKAWKQGARHAQNVHPSWWGRIGEDNPYRTDKEADRG